MDSVGRSLKTDGLTRRIRVRLFLIVVFFAAFCAASTGALAAEDGRFDQGNISRLDAVANAPTSDNAASPAPDNAANPAPVSETPSPSSADPAPVVASEPPQELPLPYDESQQAMPTPAPSEANATETSSEVVKAGGGRPEVAGDNAASVPAGAAQRELKLPQTAVQGETLSYRVNFLGIAVGYARFQYMGLVNIEGKAAHLISVKAWTSGALSFIYPVNEVINYYLDADTIQPIRIEYTNRKDNRDFYNVYDQENGKITSIYKDDGSIRKTANIVPSCHDPISVVYLFRWRYAGWEDKPTNVYAGRKIFQIAARHTGSERIITKIGPVDAVVIEPLIFREGNPEIKGEFRMWVTDDERRVPVKIFGKFRKIKDWTLVGELVPE